MEGGGGTVGLQYFSSYFPRFSIFSIQKGVQVIIGQNLNIRNISSVTMLKHIIIYKNGLVIMYIRCV